MKKVNIFKLEDRVLFDAAGVADAVDAANQAASAEASAAQEQAQDSKEALKNAPAGESGGCLRAEPAGGTKSFQAGRGGGSGRRRE